MITRTFYLDNIERCEKDAPTEVEDLVRACRDFVADPTGRVKQLARRDLEKTKRLLSLSYICIKVHENYQKKNK